jgi:hypothetical protein
LVLLAAVPVVLFVVVIKLTQGDFHTRLALAGDPSRFRAAVDQVGEPHPGRALLVDSVFALSWIVAAGILSFVGARAWIPRFRARVTWWRWVWIAAVVAGSLDLLENLLTWIVHDEVSPSRVLLLVLASVAWSKFAAYGISIVGLLWCAIGPALAPATRPALRGVFSVVFDRFAGSHPLPLAATSPAPSPEAIGICVSGGGIRAASVAIGALRGLDVPPARGGRSIFMRSRWLVAVSGGAYTAGGWRATRGPGAARAEDARDGSFDADDGWAATVARRVRYLENPTGGLTWGVVQALVRVVMVLGSIAASAYLAGWAVGRLIRSHAVHPDFGNDVGLVPARLVWPWLAPFALAAVALIVAYWWREGDSRRSALRSLALALAGAAALLAVLLVVVPTLVVYVQGLFERIAHPSSGDKGADDGAGLLGLLNALGLVGALVGVLRAQAKKRWLRLGGVLLAVSWLLFAGKVTDAYARGYPSWLRREWDLPWGLPDVPIAGAVAIALLVVTDNIASHRLTLGGLYRKRLATTFVLAGHGAAPRPPLPYAREHRWDAFAGLGGPELIVCATAHSSARGAGGIKGRAFTFRSAGITLYDGEGPAGTRVPIASYPTGSWWDGFPRGWIVSRAMALSGAAFASAMGRQALGSTNALLSATSLRLGCWVPNPRFVDDFMDPSTAPRVHLGYLAKEIFGRYDLTRDPFLYVADGGHRENLGLVELLREQPSVVFCIDTSGDRPGNFTTLKEAIELAKLELGASILMTWEPILVPDQGLPADCVTTGSVRYADGSTARLYYGRYQPCATCTAALLAYTSSYPPFPYYSTGDQFLTDEQHHMLVVLGEHVAARLVTLFGSNLRTLPT